MANDYSIGSVLSLPQNLIAAMEKADKALGNLQTKAESTAKAISTAFDAAATKGGFAAFSQAVLNTATQFDKLRQSAEGASGAIGGIKEGGNKGITDVGAQASASAESITNLTTAIEGMSAAFDGKTLTQWAVQMGDVYAKTKELTEEAKKLNEETKALNEETKKNKKNGSSSSKNSKNDEVVSYEDAMALAANAKSMREATNAVEQLKKARLDLQESDENYGQRLVDLNNEIERLTKRNKEASMSDSAIAAAAEKEAKAAEKAAQAEERKIAGEIASAQALEEAKTKAIGKAAEEEMRYLNRIDEMKKRNADNERKRAKQTEQEEKERIKTYREANLAANTTTEGALQFSYTAGTLDRIATAKEYLQIAAGKETDADKSALLMQRIAELTETEKNYNRTLSETIRQQNEAEYEKEKAARAKSDNTEKARLDLLDKEAKALQENAEIQGRIQAQKDKADKTGRAAELAVEKEINKENEAYLKQLSDEITAEQQNIKAKEELQKQLDAIAETKAKIANVKTDASLFDADKTTFSNTALTELTQKLATAEDVLKNNSDKLTASEKAQTEALIAGLKERIALRQTELKLVANRSVTGAEADAYAKQAKSLGELRNAIELYRKARENVDTSTKAGVANAQAMSDKIRELEEKYKQATTAIKGYKEAMDYAENATTINQRTQAVKYLTEARNNLSTTDAQYKKKLEALNEAIKKMNDENEKAVEGSKELRKQHRGLMNTLGQLARAFALMFSVSQIRGYIKQVTEVRGEFEMAQRSLQALLGNKAEADQIFNKTVSLAVQSPYKIKDLIQYTRQLAAYRIENSKLYDTTKRLADVSAGLGVDMQRIILAYGQVKAAAFLKGTEVRQFTEAGVNIYSELQEYFEEVKGEAYTTAEIVDMISKKKVTFEDVEAIFQRMTDKGGMFYNMQLIQSETLQGKIMKLQDSIDIALNEIGKQSESLIKWFLDSITALLGQWQALLTILTSVGSAAVLMSVKVAAASKRIQAAFTVIKASFPAASIIAALTTAITLFAEYYMAQVNAQKEERKINDTYMERISILRALEKQLEKTGDTEKRQESAGAVDAETKSVGENTEAAEENTDAVSESSEAVKESANAVDVETKAVKESSQALDENTKKRAAMQKFIDNAKKQMYVPAIDLSKVSDEDLDKAIELEEKRYDAYVRYMWLMEKGVNDNKASSWGFWEDDFVKDAQQYNEAAATYVNGAASIDMAAKYLEEAARLMTGEDAKELQKLVDEINSPKASGETEFEHAMRRFEALQWAGYQFLQEYSFIKIDNDELRDNLQAASDVVKSFSKQLFTWDGLFKLRVTGNELSKEFADAAIQTLDKAYVKIKDKGKEEQEAFFKMLIDSMAAESNIGEYAVEKLYELTNERYKLNIRPTVEIEEKSMADATNYLEQHINDYLEKKGFTIHISGAVMGTDMLENTYEYLEKELIKNSAIYEKRMKNMQNILKYEPDRVFTKEELSTKGMISDDEWERIVHEIYGYAVDAAKVESLSAKDLLDYFTTRYDAQQVINRHYGIDDDKGGGGSNDIWKDRIRLLDEMNKRYETYRDIMSEAGAKASVLEYYADSLAHVQMPQSVLGVLNAIGPSDAGTIEALDELQKLISDFDDLGDVKDKIATLKLEIDNGRLEEELNNAKTAVEEAFSGMELYKTLLSAGLGEADIRTMFKGIATSYGDVEKAIEKNLAGRQGKKWEDEYTEQKKKLEEQRSEQSVKEFTELVKEYKNAMSTRLQIDRWYWDENRKMRSNSTYLNARPELQAEMQSNLDSAYRQKIDDATWEEFRNSDYYTRIFDDLEGTSTRMLNSMSERLKSLKDSLQNLSPAQVEKVNKALSDINAMQAERNPFKYLKGGLTEYIKLLKERRDLEKSIAEKSEDVNAYDEVIQKQSKIVNEKKEAWDNAVSESGVESAGAEAAKAEYEEQYGILQESVNAQNELNKEISDENDKLDETTEKSENMKTALSGIGKFLGDASASITAAFDALSDWGINIEMPDWLSEVAGGFSAIDGAISEIVSGHVISGTFSLLGGIGKTLGGIFGWGTKDNKLSKQIEKLQDQVDSLAKAFEKLEEAMTSALSSTDIIENYESGIANLKSQIADYEEMIELERAKKDTDEDAIEEYQDAIEELQEELEDYYNSYLEMLGGLSTDEYRSAAEEFAEAWIDAFNETEDTFEALTDNLQDYLDNMLKQMVTNAASEQFLQPIFDNLNAMVEEAGDITGLSKAALDEWISDSEDYLEQYNEFLEYYFNKLGITASSSSDSSLSALQQGIQSITEETGAALESLLNSMRFYLATQQADVAVIKTTLLAMASGSGYTESSSTPMLTELKAQTVLLESIDARLASVIRAGHPKGGKALKIFMD